MNQSLDEIAAGKIEGILAELELQTGWVVAALEIQVVDVSRVDQQLQTRNIRIKMGPSPGKWGCNS